MKIFQQKQGMFQMARIKFNSSVEKADKFYLNRTSFSGKMTNPSWGIDQ